VGQPDTRASFGCEDFDLRGDLEIPPRAALAAARRGQSARQTVRAETLMDDRRNCRRFIQTLFTERARIPEGGAVRAWFEGRRTPSALIDVRRGSRAGRS